MSRVIKLGLKGNRRQFIILLIVNAFVGGMVGLERTVFPEFAELSFGIASKSALLSFIVAFGISKAITNYFVGRWANIVGRRNILIVGWLFALPIPFLLIYAPSWNWVVFANVLLGVNQGMTWSSTVVMKIDLVGEKDRGFAMGLNEFSGYFAVGLIAFFSSWVASEYGITPFPFYIGVLLSVLGLVVSIVFVNDTRAFVIKESITDKVETLDNVFTQTTFFNRNLSSITQAGLVNNLNDGMIWGLLPILLLNRHMDVKQIGIIAAVYPAVWGIGQLFTGKMSDVYSKKLMLFWGMLLQGIVILFLPFSNEFYVLVLIAGILGMGTALVYPTFLSAIASYTSPIQRAETIGVFRLWRDLGYAIGALLSGLIADYFGISMAIWVIGLLTIFSSLVIKVRMEE